MDTKELIPVLMTEGTVPVPPGRPCARDSDVIPVPGGIACWGKHKARGVNPDQAFSSLLSIFCENCIIQIGCKDCYPSLSWYDECRRPKTGHPRGGSATKTKKNPIPPVLRRDFETGIHHRENIFHDSGGNRIDSHLIHFKKKVIQKPEPKNYFSIQNEVMH